MKKIDLVVTRHPALVEYLIEKGIADENTEVIAHASPENVRGKHVAGVLPHSLSCLTESFTEIPLVLPAEKRGKELTLSDMRKFAKPAATYVIRRQRVGYKTLRSLNVTIAGIGLGGGTTGEGKRCGENRLGW